MTDIPEAAIEAAAEADAAYWSDNAGDPCWSNLPLESRQEYLNEMRVALQAAAPHLLADANARMNRMRAEVADAGEWQDRMSIEVGNARAALDRVAALADLWHTKAESLRKYIEEHDDDGEHFRRRTVLMMTEAAENELREHLATDAKEDKP